MIIHDVKHEPTHQSDFESVGGVLIMAKTMAREGTLDQPTIDRFMIEIESMLLEKEHYLLPGYRERLEILIDPVKKQARDERWRKQAEQSRWAKGILEANRKIWERHIREDELAQSASASDNDVRVDSASRVALRGGPVATVVGQEQVGAI